MDVNLNITKYLEKMNEKEKGNLVNLFEFANDKNL